MTVRLDLPPELEKRLLDEIRAGRHVSLEEAILEKISHNEDPDLLNIMSADTLRRDLDQAWQDRQGSVDGESVFARIAEKSASLRAQGK